jgi:predicted amidohydrolase
MESEERDFSEDIDGAIVDCPKKLKPFPRFMPVVPFIDKCPKKRNYNVALISLNIKFPDDFDSHQDPEKDYLLLSIKEKKARAIRDNILDLTKRAIKYNSKIIVFNELAYPFSEDDYLKPRLFELCKSNNCFIVAGSYHELKKEGYAKNKSLVFHPFDERPLSQAKLHRGRYMSRDELINVSSDRKVSLFNTEYGVFVVSICVDVASDNFKKNLCCLNRADRVYSHVDLLIVPSFTDNPTSIQEDCVNLSKMAKVCVIYVPDASFGDHSCVILGDKFIEPIKLNKRDENSSLRIYPIDLCEIWNLRKDLARNRFFKKADM